MSNLIPVVDSSGALLYSLDTETLREIVPERPDPEPYDEVADLHGMADRSTTACKCYFIGGDEGPVKIGYAANARDRLRVIQANSPVILKLLAVTEGGMPREIAYHVQFAAHRLHGEWFERCPEIEAEIARFTPQDPTP